MYCKNLSTKATVSMLNESEIFPACFSCSYNFSLLHNSLGFCEKKMILNPDASIVLSLKKYFMRILFLKLLPRECTSKYFHPKKIFHFAYGENVVLNS